MELLEREAFLAALGEYAAEAASGHGRFVVVTGEAGIGKTSLVEAFRDATPQLRWRWGACDGSFTPRPLGPLHDIAQSVGGRLREVCGADPDRNELFSAFLDELESPGVPAGVIIEDLHWADEATLDWLAYLVRRIARVAVLVIVTCRDDEPTDDNALRTTLGRLAMHGATRRMNVPALSRDAVTQLAEAGGADGAEVYRLSTGNPFYVRELLTSPGGPSGSVADLIAARTTRLSADARRLVNAAAVIGRPARADLMAAVSGVSADALDECVAAGMLAVEGNSYRFGHELARLAVEADVPPVQRQELHRICLLALDREGTDHAELAYHADGADDPKAILRHAIEAGRSAAAASAHREAVVQFERALTHADLLEPTDRADMHKQLADALSHRDHLEESLVQRDAEVALRRELGDVEALASSLFGRAACLGWLCRGKESDAVIEEACQLLQDAPGGPMRGHVLAHRALFAEKDDGYSDSRLQAMMDEARTVAGRLGDRDLLWGISVNEGWREFERGEDGSQTIVDVLHEALGAGEARMAGHAYIGLWDNAVDALTYEEFRWVYDEGLQYVYEHDMRMYTRCLRASQSRALARRGQHRQALQLVEGALRETVAPLNRCLLLISSGICRTRLTGEGLPDLLEAWDLADGSDNSYLIANAASGVAQAAWILGDASLAPDGLIAVLDRPDLRYPSARRGELSMWLHRLDLLTDRTSHIPAPWVHTLAGDERAAAEDWRRHGCPFEHAAALTCTDDPECLLAALDIFTALGSEPMITQVRRRLRAHGHPVPTPRLPRATTRAHPAGLTNREAQVLDLLGERLTNAEIAERLVLSTRTVDHHVSSVLAKLGVSGRQQAARRAAELAAKN